MEAIGTLALDPIAEMCENQKTKVVIRDAVQVITYTYIFMNTIEQTYRSVANYKIGTTFGIYVGCKASHDDQATER